MSADVSALSRRYRSSQSNAADAGAGSDWVDIGDSDPGESDLVMADITMDTMVVDTMAEDIMVVDIMVVDITVIMTLPEDGQQI